jgi:hypothetical protein
MPTITIYLSNELYDKVRDAPSKTKPSGPPWSPTSRMTTPSPSTLPPSLLKPRVEHRGETRARLTQPSPCMPASLTFSPPCYSPHPASNLCLMALPNPPLLPWGVQQKKRFHERLRNIPFISFHRGTLSLGRASLSRSPPARVRPPHTRKLLPPHRTIGDTDMIAPGSQ